MIFFFWGIKLKGVECRFLDQRYNIKVLNKNIRTTLPKMNGILCKVNYSCDDTNYLYVDELLNHDGLFVCRYDNEYGFTCRLIDLIKFMHAEQLSQE